MKIVGVGHGEALTFPSDITGGKAGYSICLLNVHGAGCLYSLILLFIHVFIHQYLVKVYQVPGSVLVERDNIKSKVAWIVTGEE